MSDVPKISVGERQGPLVTFVAHPRSKSERVEPFVPSVSVCAPFEGPFDFEDEFWSFRVPVIAEMLGFREGFELERYV
jgi:hypothetical protein